MKNKGDMKDCTWAPYSGVVAPKRKAKIKEKDLHLFKHFKLLLPVL